MVFARRVFRVAGIYGLVILLPQYFLENRIGIDYPPPITHPENFYGFVGTAVAWQVLFLVLSSDPVRYRPMMVPSVLEKLTFGIATIVLFAEGRLPAMILGFGGIDLLLGALFAVSFARTRPA
jgi:hypothetical protein